MLSNLRMNTSTSKQRIYICFLAVALFLSTIPMGKASANIAKSYTEVPSDSSLVSQGATVTPYNGMVINDGVQSNLTDGELGTMSGGGPGFIDLYLDLGQKKELNYVKIDFNRHWNKTNTVYVSDDAVTWTEVVSGDGSIGKYEYLQNTTTAVITDHNVFGAMLPAHTEGRYVRISADQDYVNINEIQVYSPGVPAVVNKVYAELPPGMHLISHGAPVTPYNGMVVHDGVQSNLTDSDLDTISGATEFIDLYLDLGQKKTLNYVAIHFARHWNHTNRVYVSDDAATWTEVVTGDGSLGKYEYLQNTTTTSITDRNVFGALLPADTEGRYVRIRTEQVYVNINEIQVYSIDAPAAVSKEYVDVPSGLTLVSQGNPVFAYGDMVFNPGSGEKENLTDGNSGTMAGGGYPNGSVDFYIDLGRSYPLNYVKASFSRFWDGINIVYISDNAQDWTPVVVGDGGMNKYEYIKNTSSANAAGFNEFGALFPEGSEGRYVRFVTKAWADLFEFQIYSSYMIEVEQFNITGGVSMEVLPGFSVQMKAEAQPSNATNQAVTWSVSPKPGSSGMAEIDSATGFLTAITAGTVTVKAEALDGSGVVATTDIVIRESIEQWRSMELSLMSSKTYDDPFADVDVVATFTGPGGIQITRPAFWDGGRIWKVRFAPTVTGTWSMTVEANPSADDTGLNRSEALTFNATPYSGALELYKRGFLQVGDNDRHFNYNDGTPFFYLGDTHWFMPSERFEGSNVEGIDSQFKYAVDHRVSQGYTVYQSQPLYMTGNYLDVSNGIGSGHLGRLQDLDRKFQYVADAGLVHANAAFTFRSILNVTDPVLLEKLGKYWQARFGAYPVLWTTAQEVDPGHEFNDYWHRIAKAIYEYDAYHQPLTAHMEGGDAGNTGWGDKDYHSWFAVQPSNLQKDGYQTFWEYNETKPYVAYETGYELNRVTTDEARSTPYRAFSNGAFGFGYGVQGVWAINDSTDSWFPYGPYYRWFDGLNAAGGSQMTHFKNFYESLQWWKLTPAFRDTTYADFTGKDDSYLLHDGNKTYIAYFAEPNTVTGTLKQMASTVYKAEWYNTRTGEYTLISEQVTPVNGQWAIPPKPDNLDWVLLVTSSQSALAPKLVVSSANQSTTINVQHGTLQLSAAVNVEHTAASVDWEVSNVDGTSTDAATIDQNGLLTALKNGVVRVTATQNVNGQLSAFKTVIITRQDKAAPPAKAQSLTVIDGGNEFLGNQQMLPVFAPNNTWDQRVEWAVFEQDGVTPTDKALISPFGVLTLLKEGNVKIVATALDGSGVTGSYDYNIQFTITNPLFVGATATASSSDYGNDYTPVKAILGNHGSFAGWSSDVAGGTSYNNPQWLQVEFAQPTVLNHIDVYTTESYFKMRDFDVQYWKDGQWVNVYSVKDNTKSVINIMFADIMTSKIRVICYVGDIAGITRIDSIEVYHDAVSHDARLNDITVDGSIVDGFAMDLKEYTVVLDKNATEVPVVGATAADDLAAVSIVQAATIPGTAVITVTAEDGTTTLNYEVNFTNEEPVMSYTVTYTAGLHGTISGTSETVTAGGNPSAVPTVTANSGYTFIGWSSDGGITKLSAEALAARAVTGNITYTAYYTQNNSGTIITPPVTPVENYGIKILINGKAEIAGKAKTAKVNGQMVTTVTVDQSKLEEKLSAEGEHPVILIPMTMNSDVAIVEFNGQMVKSMEHKGAIVEIQTENGIYKLPALQINMDAISKQLNIQAALQDIRIQIEIGMPTAEMIRIFENAAADNTFTIVTPPINFTVRGIYGDTIIDLSEFNTYIERMIAIPVGIDPNQITTGVVVDPDGSIRHVPTKIVYAEGKYYAQVNSLTNSIYAVISNPVAFTDVANHWAKEAVNDMGSRMVISGIGDLKFNPDQDITRAEFAAIIVRGLGLKPISGSAPFSDVRETDWYSSVINTAYAYNLINGFEDGSFRPLDKITREQAMAIIAKAMTITGLKAKLEEVEAGRPINFFTDSGMVSAWAKEGIADSLQAGIITGRNGSELAPKANITRAEVAVIVKRLLQKSDLIE
jgi:uncharacterized repeat protein (TIGR02543 family)